MRKKIARNDVHKFIDVVYKLCAIAVKLVKLFY